MIDKIEDYTHVVGDISSMVIDGQIMPLRSEDLSAGLSSQYCLRGEDICYLAERAMERMNLFQGVKYYRTSSPDSSSGEWPTLQHEILSANDQFAFSKIVSSGQVNAVISAYNTLLDTKGGFGIWDYMRLNQTPVDHGGYAQMLLVDGQFYLNDKSQLEDNKQVEVADPTYPEFEELFDVYNKWADEYYLTPIAEGSPLSLSAMGEMFEQCGSGFDNPVLIVRTGGTLLWDDIAMTTDDKWYGGHPEIKHIVNGDPFGYAIWGTIAERTKEEGEKEKYFFGRSYWIEPKDLYGLMNVPQRFPFYTQEEGWKAPDLYVVFYVSYQIYAFEEEGKETPPSIEYSCHYMMKMQPNQTGSEIEFSWVPQRYLSYQEFMKDIAGRHGLKIYEEQDMINDGYEVCELRATPILYILSPNMDMPTNQEEEPQQGQ